MLTPIEIKTFLEMLEQAGDKMSSATCNDFPLPNTPENWQLYLRYNEWVKENVEFADEDEEVLRKPRKGPIYFTDWLLFGYFIHKLKETVGYVDEV